MICAIISRHYHGGLSPVEFSGETTVNKLIVLFVFDKMDIPITENTIIEMCTSRNMWLTYLDCIQAITELLETQFIYESLCDGNKYYSITPDGRMCLAMFFMQIPTSLRSDITQYIKENRTMFRRQQEYLATYKKNSDGTYTVTLKIAGPIQTTLEMKLNVANRRTAKSVHQKWKEKAAQVYSTIYETLID